MIGRVEISEILGMAGACAVLLFAGFSVETLQGNVDPTRLESAEVLAPDLPESVGTLDEVRLESPELVPPVHPAPPSVSPCT